MLYELLDRLDVHYLLRYCSSSVSKLMYCMCAIRKVAHMALFTHDAKDCDAQYACKAVQRRLYVSVLTLILLCCVMSTCATFVVEFFSQSKVSSSVYQL
jgi:hypothetical protein